MSQARYHPPSVEDLPRARIERDWKNRLVWLVPIGAAALAAWFIYSNLFRDGPTLHIYFYNAAGLQRGKSEVKYRGADIGEVKDVQLTKDHQKVDVTVALDRSAASIAREGSRFWIVKPEVGVAEISGLRTIVSGDYITVEPGGGKRQTIFTGLEQAPVLAPQGVLRIVLLAEKSGSLKERTPVFYRGIQVGEVFSVDLGPDSQSIWITVDIQNHYAPLVRLNSKFWNAGGIHMSLSLSGLNIAAQSMESLLSGGLAFATPDTTEKQAPDGTSFRLYDRPEEAWLAWEPEIVLRKEDRVPHPETNTVPNETATP